MPSASPHRPASANLISPLVPCCLLLLTPAKRLLCCQVQTREPEPGRTAPRRPTTPTPVGRALPESVGPGSKEAFECPSLTRPLPASTAASNSPSRQTI